MSLDHCAPPGYPEVPERETPTVAQSLATTRHWCPCGHEVTDHVFHGEGCTKCSCTNDRGLVITHHCDQVLGLPTTPLPTPPPERPVVPAPVPLSARKRKPKGKHTNPNYLKELDEAIEELRRRG